MKKTLDNTAMFLTIALILDLAILFTSLGQIALEGQTGHWNSFWQWQAEQVVRILK